MLRVLYKGEEIQFQLPMDKPLKNVKSMFERRKDLSNLVYLYNGQIVEDDSTPDSLDLQYAAIINAYDDEKASSDSLPVTMEELQSLETRMVSILSREISQDCL